MTEQDPILTVRPYPGGWEVTIERTARHGRLRTGGPVLEQALQEALDHLEIQQRQDPTLEGRIRT